MKYLSTIILAVLIQSCSAVGVFYPPIKVYVSENIGKAALAEAEYTRKTAIEEAEARFESAKYDAKAEVERAKGVAQANEIIGNSLKDNAEYLKYLWITRLDKGNQIIYVPTETNLPVLESTRLLEASK